jgi:subtilisin family serine protease
MSRLSHRLTAALAAVLATVLAAATMSSAAPDDSAEPSMLTAGARVTLLTGDVVELLPAGTDRYAASVTPAPGRDRMTFHTLETDDSMLVVPNDVVPYLSTGMVDERLFDVPQLVADGYDDQSTPEIPLIIRYDETVAAATGTLGTATAITTFDSIDAAAIAPGKGEVGELWQSLAAPSEISGYAEAEPQFAGGITEIWLDGRVDAVLEHSVGQVGAPVAWDGGLDGSGVTIAVLDTGVDDGHPDLSGQVNGAENFTDSPTAEDKVGHGTHVAAIAAGTGAASDGARRGVAPGAAVLNGKVLSDDGYGFESWIIAGMEWAVAAGADIVNMSLGGDPTDGTDPMSLAVDRLSAETGTLFVISAGNDGASYSVGTPGAASSALTVGAVDRDEQLANFSSRGPRVGDYAAKPEITAPGVGIVAARGEGTSLGRPVDDAYVTLSGTSMAAPHVAGVAALAAQAHPDLAGDELKDLLVSTAHPHAELMVFEQGGGRVDAAPAATQGIYATGLVDFGLHTQEESASQTLASVSYVNATEAPVTLELSVSLDNLDRAAPANGALELGASQVTVPAGETVDVPLGLDLGRLERGRHSGRIVASGPGGVVARTTLATTLAGPTHSVTFRARDAHGGAAGADVLMLHGDDRRVDRYAWIWHGQETTLDVEEGTYLLHALVPDLDPQFEQATLITDPELEITGDTEVVLDAGTAVPVRIETPKPAEQRTIFSYNVHRVLPNGRTINHAVMHFSTVQQLNVTPTAPVAGVYEFSSRWQLVAPMVTATVPGLRAALDVNLLHESPTFDGKRRFPLVWAGGGTPKELSAADVAGAAALMEASDEVSEHEQFGAAAAAGADVALIVRPADFPAWTVWRPVGEREPIPAMVVAHDGGQRLIDHAIGRAGRAQIDLTLAVSSPYLYDVMHVESGRVPDRIVHRVTGGNMARFDVGYTDVGGFAWAKEQRFGWRPWQTYSWNDSQRIIETGTSREEWVSAGDTMWQHRVNHGYSWDDINPLRHGMVEAPRSYPAGAADPVTWFAPVVRPAAPAGVPGVASTRAGDVMTFRIPEFVDATSAHYDVADEFSDVVEARLLRDGQVVAELPDAWRDVETVADSGAYRLELSTQRESDEWQWASRTDTAWEFQSARTDRATPLPLLQVDYEVPADLTGHVSGVKAHQIGLSLRHQDGLPAPVARHVGVDVSFDDGATWQPAAVKSVGKRLVAQIPARAGTVSLRVHAEATDGSAVTQTVIRAYGVK